MPPLNGSDARNPQGRLKASHSAIMKTAQQHPLILATARRVDNPPDVADEPKEPVIRLKLDKPLHWDWQLTTSADALPVIQLLDKDGKLLVETSGRVAQRARGTFRDGLKSHESFPEPMKEETPEPVTKPLVGNRNYEGFSTKYGAASWGFQPRKSRSEATISSSSSSSRRRQVRKRHSSNASELEGSRSPTVKTENAGKRYSAGDYLRQQILEDLSKQNDVAEEMPRDTAKSRYKKMKAYLRSQSDGVQCGNGMSEESPLRNIRDYGVGSNGEKARERSPPTLAGRKLNKEDLNRIRKFLQSKIEAKMQEENLLQRTLSFPIQNIDESNESKTNNMTAGMNEIKKTHSHCTREDGDQGALRNYRTRKIRSAANIRFDPEALEMSKNKETDLGVLKKSSSGFDKKKFYRKTKSDVLLNHHLAGNSLDSVKDQPAETNYPTRRIKSQDNLERSWREYKERKKQERLHKEADHHQLVDDDFMKKPRWKDYQEATCQTKNCKFCENMNCVDTTGNSNVSSVIHETRKDNDRPGTSLQENYLVIDPAKPTESQAKSYGQERRDQNGKRSPDFGYNSISKRNNSTTMGSSDSCFNSNVKKSDTFKVVDGGDYNKDSAVGEVCYDYRNKTNEDIAKDYFRRVYELLRRRQEEAKKVAEGCIDERCEDTSSSNYFQEETQIKRRRRRRKMEKSTEGNLFLHFWDCNY